MKTSPWFLAAALLMVAASAGAQEKDVTFGIGVGLNPVAIVADDVTDLFLPIGLGNIYFPLVIGHGFAPFAAVGGTDPRPCDHPRQSIR